MARLRSALLRAVSPADLQAVVRKLVDMAKVGDVQAARLVIERCLGPAVPIDLVQRIEELENLLESEK